MIGSGVFDRHPKLQVLIVHMGGGLASILGRLEFNWHLNYHGIHRVVGTPILGGLHHEYGLQRLAA
jgi:predicted TIM-barrel fold metal-dependent hydrolase